VGPDEGFAEAKGLRCILPCFANTKGARRGGANTPVAVFLSREWWKGGGVICSLLPDCCDLESAQLWGQATKCMWWMPWRSQAMKDVAACEKLRGAGKRALIRRYPNGETRPARVTAA
jgi:hypothetical protein